MSDGSSRLWHMTPFREGALLALLLAFFGFLSQKALYGSFILLAVSAWMMSRHLSDRRSALMFFGLSQRPSVWWILAGIGSGMIAWAAFHLLPGGRLPLPGLGAFAWSAAAIGLAEELVYRGFLYTLWERYGVWVAVALSAAAHALYKVALLSPQPGIDLLPVLLWTLFAGLVLGLLRHFSKSTYAPALNHAIFDVLVYGGLASGPAWVW